MINDAHRIIKVKPQRLFRATLMRQRQYSVGAEGFLISAAGGKCWLPPTRHSQRNKPVAYPPADNR